MMLTSDIIHGDSMQSAGYLLLLTETADNPASEDRFLEHESSFQHIFQAADVAVWEEDFSAVRKDLEALKKMVSKISSSTLMNTRNSLLNPPGKSLSGM